MPIDDAETQQLPTVDGYRVEAVVGRGGMASVYLARQLSLDRQVAIKVMAADASESATHSARFEHEARVIARLEHPGIVGIHEVGRLADGRLFYVMPHLPNGDLAQRDLRTDEAAILRILRLLLQALGYAHAHGVVHRDVKAENVLFDAAGGPRLADFGIAIGRRRATPRITREGMALGSSGYMAPEQARGEEIDGRADLYSVGVLAYQMLTGRLPFESDDELTLALMHAQDSLPRLPDNRQHWQVLLDRAMAKWPEQRYADADAMLRGLDGVERSLARAQGSPLLRMRHVFDRPRLLAATLGAVGVLAISVWLVASRTASAPSADSLSASPTIEQQIASANSQLAAGALVVPAGGNAAETYLEVLRQQPGRADAMNGLRRVFAGLAELAAAATESGDFNALRERLQQTDLLADGLGALGDEGRQLVASAAARALEAEVTQALALDDTQRVKRGLDRFVEFDLDAGPVQALVARAQPVAKPVQEATAVVPQRGGVPQRTQSAQSALVTVGEYRRFAAASGRPPARCRARMSPLQLLDKRDWREPGFPQSESSPVVCVSVADAEAYAAWLRSQSGAAWRLPTLDERRASGTKSSLAEWTADCVTTPKSNCSRRVAFDGKLSAETSANDLAREPTRGFDEVGFRLVR